MIYLRDTNVWISYLRRKSPALVQRFTQTNPADVRLCSVVLGELVYGVYHGPSSYQEHNEGLVVRLRQQFESLTFDDPAAEQYGKLPKAYLAAHSYNVGPNDLMIAAIALANGLIVVTHNTAEFCRVPGLVVEDWQ